MIALTLALFVGASMAAFDDLTRPGDAAPRGHDGRAPGVGSKSFHGEVK